jgi:hypothetical protein
MNFLEAVVLLRVISRELPMLYAEIEKQARYPNNDDFTNEHKYDVAVDRAEIKALQGMLAVAIRR